MHLKKGTKRLFIPFSKSYIQLVTAVGLYSSRKIT